MAACPEGRAPRLAVMVSVAMTFHSRIAAGSADGAEWLPLSAVAVGPATAVAARSRNAVTVRTTARPLELNLPITELTTRQVNGHPVSPTGIRAPEHVSGAGAPGTRAPAPCLPTDHEINDRMPKGCPVAQLGQLRGPARRFPRRGR
ncbi:hypothetical protein SAV14893_087190 [Streptomyces avermitilis]|uniref:Uncharacterized protein n=1 Tax=Streptomyces avermitilis TaxID=33903 RepID=A0A4D4MBX5_STRAX|nr:hypothetical protein SAV14893_087190 [Streptomyces avermitilis]